MSTVLDLIRAPKQTLSSKAPTPGEGKTPQNNAPQIRTLFMGTPEFAATILDGLIEQKYNIVSVITKMDRKVGRKQETKVSAVKQKALEHALPILQPEKFDEATLSLIQALKPDLIVVAAYGKILPKEVLRIPGFGCVNVHASLLPLWRGASPIQNALLAGASETGVTIMLMDQGMDTGDILSQKSIAILPDETREALSVRLTALGKDLLLETLPRWVGRTLEPTKQDNALATLCQLIEREDGHIMWTESAESIYNRYRALYPWPGIFSYWKKTDGLVRLKLHRISFQKQSPQIAHPIGQVFEVGDKVGVQTGEGVVFLEEVQLEGKIRIPISEFVLGNKDILGALLQ